VRQQITVKTPGCPGARCELSSARGSGVLSATPCALTVITATTPLRLERGVVLVITVTAGSPAETAGLRAGDLLLAANGPELQGAGRLELWVRTRAPAQALQPRLLHQGQVLERTVPRGPAP